MIIMPDKSNFRRYFLISVVICTGILYIIITSKSTIIDIVSTYFIKTIFSPKSMCYSPDGSTFRRKHLRKLVIPQMDSMSAYRTENDALKILYISKNYTNLTEFIENTRQTIMSRRLVKNSQSIPAIFHNPPYDDMVKPSCDGLWMEFGVWRGNSITRIAEWKRMFCGDKSQPVYGFDTFTGLPTDWRAGHARGSFGVSNETMISVPSNAVLVKGLFIDTVPEQLLLFDRQYRCHTPVSFVHIDCDVYEGARDVLFLLGSRFVSGTILIFDELFNYPGFEHHEIKALFEFLSGSNLRLIPVGSSGYIDLHPINDINMQSFAFIIDLKDTV